MTYSQNEQFQSKTGFGQMWENLMWQKYNINFIFITNRHIHIVTSMFPVQSTQSQFNWRNHSHYSSNQHSQQLPKHQLQALTNKLEELQELSKTEIESITSYQPAIDIINKVVQLWIVIGDKVTKRKEIESKIYDNARIIQGLQREEHRKKQIIMNFRNKMYLNMLDDLKAVKKVLKYAETANIKTIVETHVNQFIYSVIHKTQSCYHETKRYGEPSCRSNCQFGELVRFLYSHKSENMANRLKQIWAQMEKELHMEISQYIRQFGENVLNWETNSEEAKNKIVQLNSQQMDMKVDLQILCGELRNYFRLVGMEAAWDDMGPQIYEEKFSSLLQFAVWQIQDYAGERQSRDIAHELAEVFYCYLDKMIFEFEKQTKMDTIDQKSSSQIFEGILTIFKEAFKKSMFIMSSKREIEIKIIRLQQEYKVYEEEQQFDQETSKSEQQLAKISTRSLLQSHRTISSKDEISISVRYNRKFMSFRVLKTMHISQSNKKSKPFVGSRNNSQMGSEASSRFNSISPHKKDKRNSRSSISYPDNFCEQINEREIVFGKSKLILKKQNPHFHQEIELKRIICIKLISPNMLNICFKKGYMSLEFLKSEGNRNEHCPTRVGSLGRQWIKCFRAVYYQEIHSVNFIDEQDISTFYFSKEVSAKNWQQLKRKSVCLNKNKENMNENFLTGNCSESKMIKLNSKAYQNEDLNYPTMSIRQKLTAKFMQ